MSINNLNKNVWEISYSENSAWVCNRYPLIPSVLSDFLLSYESAISKDEKSWFLSAKDFLGEAGLAFPFDEFEKMSLEASQKDQAWTNEIVSFWDVHVPVYMSVRGGYDYIAYNLERNEFVSGFEPEFEETSLVAKSVQGLVEHVNGFHT